MKKILFILGTRPEAIKLAPLIIYFKNKNKFNIKVCITAQHREMIDEVLIFFQIKADYDLDLMRKKQTLFDISSKGISGLKQVFENYKADLVFVQGDTTTAFIGALSAFYNKIKVAHVEAGLRSFNKYSPFPEEINRKLISNLADFHFAPTEKAKNNLIKENIKINVWNTGNTVIDALFFGLKIIRKNNKLKNYFDFVDFSKKLILVTAHRRENIGKPLVNICLAIKEIANKYNNIEFIFPVHPNPKVKNTVHEILSNINNIHLIEPVEYSKLIQIMNNSYFVLTDSGGIQEEAPSLGKPVLVMRNVTERTEGIDAGTCFLTGTNPRVIKNKIIELLENKDVYKKMANAVNPYGDGTSSQQIYDIIYNNL
jgi:UDP-N-acetylglucosamine 2-epimerase (non-hydrolysing)